MARKDFKDYSLLKWYAKKGGASKGSITRDSIITSIDYGKGYIIFNAIFEKKRCIRVDYDLEGVWEVYAKNKYSTYNDFVDAYSSEWSVDVELVGDKKYICVSVDDTRLAHSASQAFSSVRLVFASLNKFLGSNIDSFEEGDIREFHRLYLATRKKYNFGFMILSFIISVAAFVGLMLLQNSALSPYLVGLVILFVPIGILAGIFFLFNFLYFKQQLGRSIRARK